MPTPRQDYSAPALEKGVDIIELLADAETGLTISEISHRLKRRMSELFRIIVVLERRNWLQKDPESARYSLSYHLLRVAHRGTPDGNTPRISMFGRARGYRRTTT